MVNTRISKENKGAEEKQTEPATETDLETPDQSVNEKAEDNGGAEDNGIDTDAECRGTKPKVDRFLTNKHCGGHDGQHAGNSKIESQLKKRHPQRG